MAGDFDVSEPTTAELVADVMAALDTLNRWVDGLPLDGPPRYRKLVYDLSNHLANAVSAMDAAIGDDAAMVAARAKQQQDRA